MVNILLMLTYLLFMVAYQGVRLPIEDSLSKKAMDEPRVVSLVENLKKLRTTAQRIGPKHPSAADINSQIGAIEQMLLAYVDVEDERGPTTLDPSVGKGKTVFEPIESTWVSGGNNQQSFPKRSMRDRDSSSSNLGFRLREGFSEIVYFCDLLAYPWIDTSNIMQFGIFSGTDIVWGVEGIRKGKASIWTWVDSWKVKSRFEFFRTSGEFKVFHPSLRILDDSTWFAVIKRGRKGDNYSHDVVVGKIVRGSLLNSCQSQSHVVMSFDAEDSNRFELEYLPESKQLTLCHRKIIQVSEVAKSAKIVSRSDFAITLDISQWDFKPGLAVVKSDESKAILETNLFAGPSIRVYQNLSERKIIRPFWGKLGKAPSDIPSWYPKRYRTVEYWPQSSSNPSLSGAHLASSINALEPGDRLLVHGGVYSIPHRFDLRLQGRRESPIVLEAAAGERVIITRDDDRENLVNLENSQYVILSGLEFIGGSTGVRIRSANNIMVTDCIIHDTGNVGIAANSHSVSGLYLVDNEIFNTDGHAEGIYLGSHDGLATVSNSCISGNYIHDLGAGPTNQGDGIELKDGCYGNVLKRNFIARTKYPNITVYSAGVRGDQPNRILNNVLFDSEDCGIQVNSQAEVYGNIIFSRNFGVVSKPYLDEPSALILSNNMIFSDGVCLKASQWNSSSIEFTHNTMYSKARRYFYAGTGLATSKNNTRISNLPEGFREENYLRFIQPIMSPKKFVDRDGGFVDSFGFLSGDVSISTGSDVQGVVSRDHVYSPYSSRGRHGDTLTRIECRVLDDQWLEFVIPPGVSLHSKGARIRINLIVDDGKRRIDGFSIVAHLTGHRDAIYLWAKDDKNSIYFQSVDISSAAQNQNIVDLKLVATFLESISIMACDPEGNLIVASSKGLLVIQEK